VITKILVTINNEIKQKLLAIIVFLKNLFFIEKY
jgi:hypothetical protein